MLKCSNNEKDFLYILDNLRVEDFWELNALWGENWRERTLNSLKNTEVLVLYGKDCDSNQVPIAMGGFYEIFGCKQDVACVWLLSTKHIEYNKPALMRALRKQIKLAENKYSFMYNCIYRTNNQAKNWLRKLGFCFDNPKPKNIEIENGFEFFYKITNRKEC